MNLVNYKCPYIRNCGGQRTPEALVTITESDSLPYSIICSEYNSDGTCKNLSMKLEEELSVVAKDFGKQDAKQAKLECKCLFARGFNRIKLAEHLR